MFADDINLFYSHYQIKTLFETVNCELKTYQSVVSSEQIIVKYKKTNYTIS